MLELIGSMLSNTGRYSMTGCVCSEEMALIGQAGRWKVGAVGIEIASLLRKDLHGNDLVPLPQFQLLSNVVKSSSLPARCAMQYLFHVILSEHERNSGK